MYREFGFWIRSGYFLDGTFSVAEGSTLVLDETILSELSEPDAAIEGVLFVLLLSAGIGASNTSVSFVLLEICSSSSSFEPPNFSHMVHMSFPPLPSIQMN